MSDVKIMPKNGAFLARYRNENDTLIADTYGWQDGKLKKFVFNAGKVTWEDVPDGVVHELKSNPDVIYTVHS